MKSVSKCFYRIGPVIQKDVLLARTLENSSSSNNVQNYSCINHIQKATANILMLPCWYFGKGTIRENCDNTKMNRKADGIQIASVFFSCERFRWLVW